MKTINVYFDTEFTGLVKNTDLISIGMVAYNENDDNWTAFYHEFTDYDKSKVSPWVQENVIANLIGDKKYYPTNISLNISRGDKEEFKDEFERWVHTRLAIGPRDKICLVSDCSSYDHVLFNDIYGGAFEIPTYILPQVYDIIHDIYDFSGNWEHSFDVSREELCRAIYTFLPKWVIGPVQPIIYERMEMNEDMKHNALYDALTIAQIHQGLVFWKRP